MPMDKRAGQEQLCLIAQNPGGLAVLPESVLPPRFGTQEFGCFSGFTHKDTKCCLDLSCRFYHTRRMYYTVDISMHPNLSETRYVGRSNCHDHRIQIQMFLRKKATGGELHNQTVRVQSASALSVCVRRAEKTLVRLSLQNADLELLSS